MNTFYEPGDCFPLLKTANEQIANGEHWREQLQLKEWVARRSEIFKAINELWVTGNSSWVNIWEDWWFPGIEQFLIDLQKMGYHVYVGSPERPNNQGMTQKRYCVYLEALPDKKEWSIDEDLKVKNCSDCKHYFYYVGEAGCNLDCTSYPEICEKFTPDTE